MIVSECVQCIEFPCQDVNHSCYIVPNIEVMLEKISIIMISEAAPADPSDYFYAEGDPLFQKTTLLAFNDAGVSVKSIKDILGLGVYLTTAVKCGKTGYGIKSSTINQCSHILEKELELFDNVEAYLLMGDVAIRSISYIAKRVGEGRVIPSGSTYKIRGAPYFFRGKPAFPSYLQAGPSFFIEKSKRKMIAEDINNAFSLLKH